MSEDKDKARFWSVSNEDAEFTKHWIRQFILSNKLGVAPQMPPEDMKRLRGLWSGRNNDDIQEREYRMLWQEAEKEMQDDR